MATHTSKRIGVLGGIGVGLAGLALIVGVGFSAPPGDLPNLTTEFPTIRPNARFVDTVEVPGRTLFRFDSVIRNSGGALEVYRADGDPTTYQKVWTGGTPGGTPTGGTPLGSVGEIRYSYVTGHEHFHTQLIAGYELDTTGGSLVHPAAKNTAGFCLYDSYGQSPPLAPAFYANDCHKGDPGYTGPIREGISNGWGDFYGSDLGDQWVDVTDVTPGDYVLAGTANPARLYAESAYGEITKEPVTIPGAIVNPPAPVTTPAGTPIDIPVKGTVVGADVKSRSPQSATCTAATDTETKASCLQQADPTKLTFQAGPASSGAATVVSSSGLTAVARYTPPAGFNGTATFAVTARDTRGLTSTPATVTVTVGSGGTGGTGGSTGTGGTTGGTTAKATVKLRPTFHLVHRGGKTFLTVKGRLPASQAGRLVKVQRRLGKRISTIGLAKVARTGRYARLIRVHTSTLSVRTALGSNARTKAALSSFRRVTG